MKIQTAKQMTPKPQAAQKAAEKNQANGISRTGAVIWSLTALM